MELLEQAIKQCGLLQQLPPKLVAAYYKDGTFIKRTYGRRELIHAEGDHCDQMEIVIRGEIAVERIDISGSLLTVTAFTAGNTIGANLLFSSHPYYPMTVTSKAETTVLILKRSLVFKLCNEYPAFLMTFLEVISDHSVLLGTKIKQHVSRTIREAITAYLTHESFRQNSHTVRLTHTKKALAELMGVSRTSLSRELQKMKHDGLIDFDQKSITVLEEDLLKNRVGGGD